VRPLLQDREQAEARRLKDHAKRKAREQAAIEDNKRRLGELFLEVQRREDRLAAIDAELRPSTTTQRTTARTRPTPSAT
jgi:hypothetical protein